MSLELTTSKRRAMLAPWMDHGVHEDLWEAPRDVPAGCARLGMPERLCSLCNDVYMRDSLIRQGAGERALTRLAIGLASASAEIGRADSGRAGGSVVAVAVGSDVDASSQRRAR